MAHHRRITFFVCLSATLLLCLANSGFPADKKRYEQSLVPYKIPDVTLINQDRQEVRFKEIFNSDKPVLLDFIYGTCTTICPVLSAGFSHMQKKLGEDVGKVRFVSISIDPEHDTPEVMKDYLERYRAKPGWDFLTGTREDIDLVMRSFNAYVPNKMNHYPLTFLWAPGNDKWVRIYGMISTSDLMTEYEEMLQDNNKQKGQSK